MGFFDILEQDGIRFISGSVNVKCWSYGVFETGETFYFTCNRRSARLCVLVRDWDKKLPFENPDWQMHYQAPEISPGVAMWPSDQECVNYFSRLKHEFQQSTLAGIALPMSQEHYDELRAREFKDMIG